MLTVVNRRPMNIKTPLCREFEKDVINRLQEYKKDCIEFKNCFDPKLHFISAEYFIFTPKSSLFTKDDKISSKSVDLDAHKTLQDTIFKFIDLDDKLIRDVRYCSPISNDDNWNFVIVLKLEKLCNLENMSILTRSSIEQPSDESTYFALL